MTSSSNSSRCVVDLLVRHPGREALVQALVGELAEPLVLGQPVRRVQPRHQVPVGEHPLRVHLLRDQQGVPAALLPDVVAVDRPHLVGGLQVVAVAAEPEAVRVGDVRGGLDAQQRVVRGGLFAVGVVRVVGDHRRDVELAADVQQALADPGLDVQAVVHQLQVEVLLAEDLLVLRGGLQRLVELAQPQPGLHVARGAAGGGHQAGGVLAPCSSASMRGYLRAKPSV